MTLLLWIAGALLVVLPVAVHVAVLWRSPYLRMHLGIWLATIGTAAALVIPITLVEQLLERWAEIDPVTGAGGQVTLLLYAFFVVSPLEMGTVMLAVLPFWRLRRVRMRAGLSRTLETREGVSFAVSAAFGFKTAENAIHIWLYARDWLALARLGLGLLAFVLLCALWGYVLGRNASRGLRGRRFSSAALGAMIFSAVCEQLIFRHGALALLSVLPLLASMLVVTYALWIAQHQAEGSSGSGRPLSSFFASAPGPSIHAIREAFRKQDQPLTLRWISFGALVTTGMITAGVVGAVALGHELGLDFSAVDRHEASADAMAPLALLGLGALAAFPSSGYLLARASGTRSVLEPAMASALAILLLMVFLGMVAPVAVVFVIAFAPIAFALSCAGAWVGVGS